MDIDLIKRAIPYKTWNGKTLCNDLALLMKAMQVEFKRIENSGSTYYTERYLAYMKCYREFQEELYKPKAKDYSDFMSNYAGY